MPETLKNRAFQATTRPVHLLFHSVFHRCGNLGGETELDPKAAVHEAPDEDAREL
jgi:hypothetical protein